MPTGQGNNSQARSQSNGWQENNQRPNNWQQNRGPTGNVSASYMPSRRFAAPSAAGYNQRDVEQFVVVGQPRIWFVELPEWVLFEPFCTKHAAEPHADAEFG